MSSYAPRRSQPDWVGLDSGRSHVRTTSRETTLNVLSADGVYVCPCPDSQGLRDAVRYKPTERFRHSRMYFSPVVLNSVVVSRVVSNAAVFRCKVDVAGSLINLTKRPPNQARASSATFEG